MKKKLLIAALAVGVLSAPAAAEANHASWQDVSDAKYYARSYWKDQRGIGLPCYGVGIRYKPMYGGTLGEAQRYGCTVWLNSRADWHSSWNRLCWTMIHEYGHLLGYGHTSKRGSVMYPYSQRWWYCNP